MQNSFWCFSLSRVKQLVFVFSLSYITHPYVLVVAAAWRERVIKKMVKVGEREKGNE